jgi:hypothetical protein
MKRPSLLERAMRAALRHANRYFDAKYCLPRHSQCRLDYGEGYLAGYRAAKRERK